MAAFVGRTLVVLVAYTVGLLIAAQCMPMLDYHTLVYDIVFYVLWGAGCAVIIHIASNANFSKTFLAASLVLIFAYVCQLMFSALFGLSDSQALDGRLLVTIIFCAALLAMLLDSKWYWR